MSEPELQDTLGMRGMGAAPRDLGERTSGKERGEDWQPRLLGDSEATRLRPDQTQLQAVHLHRARASSTQTLCRWVRTAPGFPMKQPLPGVGKRRSQPPVGPKSQLGSESGSSRLCL